jgi:hypothetical protein
VRGSRDRILPVVRQVRVISLQELDDGFSDRLVSAGLEAQRNLRRPMARSTKWNFATASRDD